MKLPTYWTRTTRLDDMHEAVQWLELPGPFFLGSYLISPEALEQLLFDAGFMPTDSPADAGSASSTA